MTERFSPEYIAYILSDEASVLQEGHEWTLGDWFVHRETESIGLLAIKPDDKILFVKKEAISWLPSLSDLLGMIEEAGHDYVLSGWWEENKYLCRISLLYSVLDERSSVTGELLDDPLLAAAKLAVRVLEEGKGIERFDWEQDVQRELMDA